MELRVLVLRLCWVLGVKRFGVWGLEGLGFRV